MLVEVGSTAHGTGIPGGEDHDEMGVVVETPSEVFGLGDGRRSTMHRTQPEGTRSGPGDTDRNLHSLRRFVKLAGAGNPSILMCFWAPVIRCTDEGEQLRSIAPWFVGRHVIPRYRGYMESQAMRLVGTRGLSGHGRRGGGQRDELVAEHGYDTKFAMHCARLGFQGIELLTTGKLELPIQGEPGDWLRDVRHGRVLFEDWWDRALSLHDDLGKLASDTSIPAVVDAERIGLWSAEMHRYYWSSSESCAS